MDRIALDSRTSSVRIAFSSMTAAEEEEEASEAAAEAAAEFDSANGSPTMREDDDEEDEEKEADEADRCCAGAGASAGAGDEDEEDEDEAAADSLILSTILVLSGRSSPSPTLCSNESTTEAILAAVADCVCARMCLKRGGDKIKIITKILTNTWSKQENCAASNGCGCSGAWSGGAYMRVRVAWNTYISGAQRLFPPVLRARLPDFAVGRDLIEIDHPVGDLCHDRGGRR